MTERIRRCRASHGIFHGSRTFPRASSMVSFESLAMHGHEHIHARAKSTATHFSYFRPS
jgi:hypothetical protein